MQQVNHFTDGYNKGEAEQRSISRRFATAWPSTDTRQLLPRKPIDNPPAAERCGHLHEPVRILHHLADPHGRAAERVGAHRLQQRRGGVRRLKAAA